MAINLCSKMKDSSAGSRPWDKVGGEGAGEQVSKKIFFWLFGPQFGLKMRRGADPRAPPLDHHWIVTNVLTLAHPI